MNILLSIILFVVGIFMGAYLARLRIDSKWTVAQEFDRKTAMATIRASKKLKLAGEVLAGERFCDSDDQFVVELVKKGKITTRQVYRALHHFGYRWQRGEWRLIYPAWIIKSHRWGVDEDHRILQGKR